MCIVLHMCIMLHAFHVSDITGFPEPLANSSSIQTLVADTISEDISNSTVSLRRPEETILNSFTKTSSTKHSVLEVPECSFCENWLDESSMVEVLYPICIWDVTIFWLWAPALLGSTVSMKGFCSPISLVVSAVTETYIDTYCGWAWCCSYEPVP